MFPFVWECFGSYYFYAPIDSVFYYSGSYDACSSGSGPSGMEGLHTTYTHHSRIIRLPDLMEKVKGKKDEHGVKRAAGENKNKV